MMDDSEHIDREAPRKESRRLSQLASHSHVSQEIYSRRSQESINEVDIIKQNLKKGI